MSDALAGKDTTIKVAGTATALTNEPTTKLTANTVYQITDATKQVLDPDTAIVVEVDPDGAGASPYATALSSSYAINYMSGTITFTADQGASALVRIASGKYLPLLSVATARGSSMSCSTDAMDQTRYGDQAVNKLAGRRSLEGSFEVLEDLTTDHDPGAGSVKFKDLIDNGTPLLTEYRPGGAGKALRAWIRCEKGEIHTKGDDVLNSTVSFTGISKSAVGRTEKVNRSWVTP